MNRDLAEKLLKYAREHGADEARSLIRRASEGDDWLDKKVENPDTGNEVKLKSLKDAPEGSQARQLYEKAKEKAKGESDGESEGGVDEVTEDNFTEAVSQADSEEDLADVLDQGLEKAKEKSDGRNPDSPMWRSTKHTVKDTVRDEFDNMDDPEEAKRKFQEIATSTGMDEENVSEDVFTEEMGWDESELQDPDFWKDQAEAVVEDPKYYEDHVDGLVDSLDTDTLKRNLSDHLSE